MAEERRAMVSAEVLLSVPAARPGSAARGGAERRGRLAVGCPVRNAERDLEPLGVRWATWPRSWELVRLRKADFFAALGLCWACGPFWGALDEKGRFSSEMALFLVLSFPSHEFWKGSTTVCAETVCVNPLD